MNRLSEEKSPYLRNASRQKIDWYPWSEEAFETARQQDKPVFLSSGAVWCHWCHVMAQECFENEEIVRLLNEKFISIKLDRDERPDIDRRYQNAILVMGFAGGWPLSFFLTPEKKPFFGGTYFPPEDGFGRPGFKRILKTVSEFYRSNKQEIHEYSRKILDVLKPHALQDGTIDLTLIDKASSSVLSQFDPQNGGFGSSPKFPMPGAVEFLINQYYMSRSESLGYAIRKTLDAMAKGGFHDQIGGGFHRYSVDEAWIVPHFEKMADDNAWHLRNYLDAYRVFGVAYYREVAKGIMDFIGHVLSDPEGGFYTSQDADVTPDDEGGYFTWTDYDFKKLLNSEEYKVLSLHLLNDRGTMHHDKAKRVLCVSLEIPEIAQKTGMDEQTVLGIIYSGKKTLLEERNKRKVPFIDRTFYTSLNGMMITAYLKAFRAGAGNETKAFALRSLGRILNSHWINGELFHTKGIKAFLDDYMYLTDAFIASYEVTGESRYLDQAVLLMESCLERFWDKETGGFFDTEDEVIGLRLKGIEDIPHPSSNALGIILLLKLFYMTERKAYREHAEASLRAFSGVTGDMGIHAGYYFSAADAYFNMMKLKFNTLPDSILAKTALASFIPYASIIHGNDDGCIVPCTKDVCFEPVNTPQGWSSFLKNLPKMMSGRQ